MQNTHISLAHGNGGRLMQELIANVFAKHLQNPELDTQADAVALNLTELDADHELVITTDGFTVQPLQFPGGDIGSLAVHGTTNDLAVAGALPRYLSLNAFIEEGLAIAELDSYIASLAQAAQALNVKVVAGDTKVVRRGEGSGLYLATTGIGIRHKRHQLGLNRIQVGDKILVSGSVGDHGIAVMLAREQFGLRGDLRSDAASVLALTQALLHFDGLRFMRDPTRGGLTSVVHEISQATGYGLNLSQIHIPIKEAVQSVCDMLGYDPLYLACEGRVIAVVAADQTEAALTTWRALPEGQDAEIIGEVTAVSGRVMLTTPLGGQRFLEPLEDDPLPRIC